MIEKTRSVLLEKAFVTLLLFSLAQTSGAQPYNFYYGNIHSHSGYSDGNADSTSSTYSTPAEDYDYALASAHFDFLGISDHNHSSAGMQLADYHLGVAQAVAANQPGVFAALYGMEWGVISTGGHLLVYGIDSLVGWQSGNYDIFCGQSDYAQLFALVNARPGSFCTLAHPQTGDYGNLNGIAYNAAADNAVSGTALRSGSAFSTTTNYSDPPATLYESYYKTLLGKGYHLGPLVDHDNHNTTFGRTLQGRTVVLANSLTKQDILGALDNMRFYASDDWNVEVNYTLNGLYMGSVADISANPTLSVSVSDPDGEGTTLIAVYHGVPGSGSQPTLLTSVSNTGTLTYTHSIANNSDHYYYLKIQQTDGHQIWTAPIWVHKTSGALPLELITWQGKALKDRIQLDWTALVPAPGVFEVERSTDGVHFSTLGELQAMPSNDTQAYVFFDLQPVEGLAFYRLKAVEADESYAYSAIISVPWNNPDLSLLLAGPNPVSHRFDVLFSAQKEETYHYFLYDETGRELRREPFDTRLGVNALEIDVTNLPGGLYFLILGKPGRRILETKIVKAD